ncbi:hypothetical protein MMC25_002763 [Agyrium rufum]|nr:hypothetical protein [Agyrium rufum]
MGPVTIAILATLLPTSLLILGLVYLSIYLHIKSRSLRKECKGLQAQLTTATEDQLALKRHKSEPYDFFPSKLSDESNIQWSHNVPRLTAGLMPNTLEVDHHYLEFHEPRAESWIGHMLEALGYQDASPTVILGLLRGKEAILSMPAHIVTSIALARTSIDSDPESTLLPFSPELQKDLQTFFKAMEGLKFSPEFSSFLAKMPPLLASQHGGVNEERVEKSSISSIRSWSCSKIQQRSTERLGDVGD